MALLINTTEEVKMPSRSTMLGVGSLALLLTSCGGGGGSGGSNSGNSAPPPVSNAAVGGIWQGKDPISGDDILGVVAEDGRSQFIAFDSVPFTQYWGSLTSNGTNISGTNFQVAAGQDYFGTASISGSITARQSMQLTVAFTPAAGCPATTCGTARTASGTLTFNSLYNRGGALSRTAGNWQDVITGQVYNINASGVVFQQDAQTGCVINGQVSVINTNFNAYSANYNFSSCRVPFTNLNGTQATGLIVVDDSVTPNRIYLGAQYRASGVTYTVYGEAVKR
jgi:hypothetical protein